MKIKILGEEWTIEERNESEDPALADFDGYCDSSVRKIVVDGQNARKEDLTAKRDLLWFKRKVYRHEIVHAFLEESGLSESSFWATNEEMVDWIALQFPKLLRAFTDAGCLE
jgi:hypothetical protein